MDGTEAVVSLGSLLDQAGEIVTSFTQDIGGPILDFIVSNPLCLIPALAGICVMGIGVIRRFVYGA